MGFDKNKAIGFALIGLLLVGMLYYNSRNKKAFDVEEKRIADSTAAATAKPKQIVDTVLAKLDAKRTDSIKNANQTKGFKQDSAKVQLVTLENEVVKIILTTKGAQPALVELKQFKKYDSSNVILQKGDFNKFTYKINAGNGLVAESENLVFTAMPVVNNADGSKSISFKTGDSSGAKEIIHQYTLKPNDYMVDLNIVTKGSDLFTDNKMSINWQTEAPYVEKDHKYELTQGHIGFATNDGYDFENAFQADSKLFEKPVNWIASKQQFFITALVAKNKFESGSADWKLPDDTTGKYLYRTNTNMKLAAQSNGTSALQFYYGPSDYNVLKKYDNKMENIVPYGTGIFSFVKYINRYFLLPVFDFFQKHIGSMGIVILLLTLLIRLITSPILYKSYLSGAKMKLLKPEVDALKAKHTDKTGTMDQQAFSMEQMKLWKQAGVSPLGGCLPALLQIPIFMSLYYFFQCNVDLRGKSFLWSKDLAAYDSILKLPFDIPFYGDHVSLFTLTAVITSMLISIYSMSNMQDNSNPVMKYMPYIFPVLLLGVFNNLPSALTWYYTISNTITLLLQIFIQKYVINHDKIKLQMEENKKKPVKQSKLAEKVAAMQESQRKIQEMKNKGK
jgi:YidC/Oxa1 family membrane protein insertase